MPLLSAVLAMAGATPDECRAALHLRAQAREALGDAAGALRDLEHAVERYPRDARLRNALGILLADKGDVVGSIQALSAAVELDPGYARAWNNLANALRSSGRIDDAAEAARRAVAAQPEYALAWSNLGAILLDLGDESGARDAFRRALAQKPDLRTIRALAAIARQRGDVDEAVELYARANAAQPGDANTLLALAGALAERDDLEAARRNYAEARARSPGLLRAAFGERLLLPMVYADAAAVDAARARYAEGVAALEAEVPSLVRGRAFADVIDDLRWTNFLLAYQGEDDRELQARFAAVMARAVDDVAPQWRQPLPRSVSGARIRIGFASSFFADGTCGRYFRSWIAGLDRTRFEIFVYHLRRDATPFLRDLSPHADRVRTFAGASLLPSAMAAGDPRRCARRARLSRARDERTDVRAGGAASRSRPVCGLGPSGDDRTCDDRRLLHLRRDGACRCAGTLLRAADRAARHRHRLRASAAARRGGRRGRATACRRARPSSCAPNRCSRSTPKATRCSRACCTRSRPPGSSSSKAGIRRSPRSTAPGSRPRSRARACRRTGA